jgi:pyruvate dehydrogenase E2 component (dihydrolipoamide acetyltransferase)
MAQVLQMLALSPTMEEGTIVKWHKKEGDQVSQQEVLADVETDKATMEYESSESGTILKILVPEGSAARIGQPIAIIGNKGEDISSLMPQAVAEERNKPLEQEIEDTRAAAATQASPPPPQPAQPAQPAPEQLRSTPAARKLAQENGIDINTIHGTGPQGRVTEQDVQKALQSKPAPAPAQPPKAPAFTPAQPMADETIPLSQMRKTIAKRLSESKFSAPDYYVRIKVNAENLINARQHLIEKVGSKISLNALLIKFSAEAIKQHPIVNSTWNNDSILKHGTIDIGLAVAQENGLVTPVVRNCANKGIVQIDSELQPLIQKALSGTLQPQEYSNATFTISNLGSFGIEEFTAIINPPGSAILAVGAIERIPVAVGDELAIQAVMNLTLTCDHRVIDGAAAARFMQTLKELMEFPASLLY